MIIDICYKLAIIGLGRIGVSILSRPRKWRKVCCLPKNNLFGPLEILHANETIVMSIDEYETIRLIDLQGFTQEQAANQMNVARSTVQRIYNEARKKLARTLVDGKVLKIEGGDYLLCNGFESSCKRSGCRKHRNRKNT